LNRFSTRTFLGLPLTLVMAVCYVNLLLLSELAESVVESEGIVRLDEKIAQLLYSMRTEWLSRTFYVITQLGSREAVFIVGGACTGALLKQKRYLAIVVFWFTMAGAGLSVQEGKKYIDRSRPEGVAYYAEVNRSFPSGHSTTAMALYGLLAYLLFRYYAKARRHYQLLGISFFLIILAVGASRIYLGVHFLSDVLAGYLLGASWVLLGISIIETLSLHQRNQKEKNI